MRRKGISTLATLLLLVIINTLAATDLKAESNEKKNFVLNEKVGPASLKFFSEAPMEDIEGSVSYDQIESNINIDPSNFELCSGTIVFKVAGMKSGIKTRDKHLRSSTWLDAKKYPEISFAMKSIKDVKVTSSGNGKTSLTGTAVGEFSMHGKTNAVTAPITLTYLKESAATQKKAKGDLFFAEGELIVALKDYNVKGKAGIVGSKVGEKIKTTFKLFYSER